MVDFAVLKQKVGIEQIVELLGLELKRSGEQLRGKCPIHGGDNPRHLVITPSRNLFYCFEPSCGKGGDQLQLYAEVKKVSTKVAAEEIAKAFSAEPARSDEFGPLPYLQHDHPAMEAIGMPTEVGEGIGAGYAPKGVFRGYCLFPLRKPDGRLIGYIAVNPAADPPVRLPKQFHV